MVNIFRRRGLITLSSKTPKTPALYLFNKLNSSRPIKLSAVSSPHYKFSLNLELIENFRYRPNLETERIDASSTSTQEKRVGTGLSILFKTPGESKTTQFIMGDESPQLIGDRTTIFKNSVYLSTSPNVNEPTVVERYTELDKQGRVPELLEIVNIVDKRIKRLAIMIENTIPMLGCDIGYGLIPLVTLGGGITTLVNIILAIFDLKDAVTLIDEIENSFHYSVYDDLWVYISEFSKKMNSQIFATTHSRECLEAAYRAFNKSDTFDLAIHRLVRKNERIEAFTLGKEEIQTALDTDWEIR